MNGLILMHIDEIGVDLAGRVSFEEGVRGLIEEALNSGDKVYNLPPEMGPARFITELSIKHRKPISLGIAGPGMTVTQAKNRITTVSKMAVDTAIDMVERLKRLENVTKSLEREKEIVID